MILSAPDIGQLLLTGLKEQSIIGYTEGSRKEGWIRIKIELPVPKKTMYPV